MATYFVDNDLTAVAKALAAVRDDVVYPGYGSHGIEPETLDPAWLPIVGRLGLVVITRDKHIRYRPAEVKALVENSVRAFVMTGAGNMSSFDTLRLLLHHWERMDEVVAARGAGPWMWSVTRGGVAPLKLSK